MYTVLQALRANGHVRDYKVRMPRHRYNKVEVVLLTATGRSPHMSFGSSRKIAMRKMRKELIRNYPEYNSKHESIKTVRDRIDEGYRLVFQVEKDWGAYDFVLMLTKSGEVPITQKLILSELDFKDVFG